MTRAPARDRRGRELALIHVAKKVLALDDGTYRDLLWMIAGVKSAADLDAFGRSQLIHHFRAKGFLSNRVRDAKRPHNIDSEIRGPLLKKIEAFLLEAGRPWAYAHGMARRMYLRDRVELLDPTQLRGIVAALAKDAARHGRRTK